MGKQYVCTCQLGIILRVIQSHSHDREFVFRLTHDRRAAVSEMFKRGLNIFRDFFFSTLYIKHDEHDHFRRQASGFVPDQYTRAARV